MFSPSLAARRANKLRQAAWIRSQNELGLKTMARATGLAIVSLCLFWATLWAQGPAPKTPNVLPLITKQAAPPTSIPTLSEADLRAFVDGIVPLQLERGNIAGAVVLVVKDGQILFAKGYGYADVATKKPVTPDDDEIESNPRSRSAKLRAAVKQ